MKDWNIQAEELVNCNCEYGCPCQFSVRPSDGHCDAVVVFDIEKGHYGDVKLDGLRAAGVYHWPGAIHEGQGEMQLIIGEGATAEQRAALEAVMTGQDTDEMATMWFVFSTMCPTKHETLTASIELDWDRESRTGNAKVGDIFEIDVKPIPNAVTGEPHRISIQLPFGFEFRHAEMASGRTATSGGKISMSFDATHAHLARLNLTGHGVAA